MKNPDQIRTICRLTQRQRGYLEERSKEIGIPITEYIRRLIDDEIREQEFDFFIARNMDHRKDR